MWREEVPGDLGGDRGFETELRRVELLESFLTLPSLGEWVESRRDFSMFCQ